MIAWLIDGKPWGEPEVFTDTESAMAEFERRRERIVNDPQGLSLITTSQYDFSYAYGKSRNRVVTQQSLVI